MASTKKRLGFVALMVLQTFIFGFGNAITKEAYADISPFWCLTLRFGLAVGVFALFFGPRIVAQLRQVKLRTWLPAAVCMALTYILGNLPLNLTTATNVGFLVSLSVMFVPLLSSLMNHRKYPMYFVPPQVAVLLGLFLLCCNGGSLSFGLGEGMALVSSITLAGALVLSERGLGEMDVVAVAGTQVGTTFVLSLAGALAFEAPVNVAAITPFAWGTIAFLALLSTCLTFFIQIKALTVLKSSTVSLMLTGEPVFTALFSFVLLGESLGTIGLAGAAIIVGAVAVGTVLEGCGPQLQTLLSRRRTAYSG